MTLDQFVPGARVYITMKDADGNPKKILGTVGNLWGANGPTLVVRFDDDRMTKITENMAKWFNLEPQN